MTVRNALPTCCVASRWRDATTSGAPISPISPTSVCSTAFSTWSPCLTGIAATCWRGSCPIRLSNPLDTSVCLAALEAAEAALAHGNPVIFNTDQGVQFISAAYTSRLEQAGIQISWDGRGRALDNEFVERLWRALKWEELYLKDYQTVAEAVGGLERSFRFYNYLQ